MSEAVDSGANRSAVAPTQAGQRPRRADRTGHAGEAAAPPAVAFVQSALRDLRDSMVRLRPGLCDRWFATAFNDWYCPAVRRGFVGGMAPVFDIGVTLVEPAIDIRAQDGHGKLLQWMKDRPLIRELAARAVAGRAVVSSDDAVSVITWTMVEPLLRCLSGVWDSAVVTAAAGELPSVEFRRNQLLIYTSAYGKMPAHKLDMASIDPATAGAPEHDAAPAARPGIGAARRVTGCALPTVHAIGARLFAARISGLLPQLAHKLDHELAEACLFGPVLGERDHEPPRRLPADVATTQQSQQPGAIAGVTRVETKRPGDPLVDILPSELMVLRRSRPMGFANLLYGKPLVFVHERERDVVPKHRALVCCIVDAHQSVLSNHRAFFEERPSGCPYRDGYVYAKRQVCDMLHDLADAQSLARRTMDLEIEASVFAVPPGGDQAVVHQRIPLDGLKRVSTGDGKIDRLNEMMAMAELVPGYFIRYVSEWDRSLGPAAGRAADVLPTDVVHYLRKASRQGRYRMMHLVIVCVDKASRMLERLYRYLHYQSATPMRITLIGLDLDRLDSDVRLVSLREPAWTYVEVASLREAIALSAETREPTPLSELRARFIESVLGKEIEPTEAQLGRIQSN
jgi:hypothetical protein